VPSSEALDLDRLRWELTAIAVAVGRFRRSHGDDGDTRVAWASLERYLDPAR
jgi:hypothetical protein